MQERRQTGTHAGKTVACQNSYSYLSFVRKQTSETHARCPCAASQGDLGHALTVAVSVVDICSTNGLLGCALDDVFSAVAGITDAVSLTKFPFEYQEISNANVFLICT